MRLFPLLLLLTACAGTPAADRAAPAPTSAPAAPAPKAEVGPDGPTHLAIPEIGAPSSDPAVIAQGEAVFNAKGCGGCHAFGSKLVGPDLTGITDRRTVAWTARMIRHPDAMTKEDPVAKAMFRELMVQMPDQGVSDGELPALIAFLHAKK